MPLKAHLNSPGFMIRSAIIFMMMFLISGCAMVQPVIETTDTVTVTHVLRDTTVVLQPDSATVQALFYCDSMNQVIMKDLVIEKGRNISPLVKWEKETLTVLAEVDSQQVYLEWKERHVMEQKKTTETVIVKQYKKQLPLWVKLVMIAESVLLLFFAIGLVRLFFQTRN